MSGLIVGFCIVNFVIGIFIINLNERKMRKHEHALEYIMSHPFPAEINRILLARYPHLTEFQADRVIQGLRSYFYICRKYDYQTAMPSRVVDAAWHEFLLFSQDYLEFSYGAFGNYFHHIPKTRLESPLAAQKSLTNAWRLSCLEEDIDPNNPQCLPLLFALDTELAIADGFIYSIEAGIYPRKIEGIPPNQLLREIERTLPLSSSLMQQKSAEWKAETDRLAVKIKFFLFDYGYCTTHGHDALVPLFDGILARKDLTVAIFGDIALAKGRLSTIRQLPQPVASCG
ncbi:MAG: hypothetical protein NTV43_15255 [Methylococcales bacterium]|nr:hypothetical protein [Methylococcales bacterium]